jgi:hypothetical protein
MLVNNGINTNEKLKKFLLDPRILSLRERFLNLESEHKKGFVVVISGFPLHIFWLMFGIRLKACNQMLDELESTVEPKE